MNRQEIADKLLQNYREFTDIFDKLDDEQFTRQQNDKWSAGQQLEHIYRSTRPLVLALSLPSFAPKTLFGSANRPSKSYDELVKKYLDKIRSGGKATGVYVPPQVLPSRKKDLQRKVMKTVNVIANRILNKSEEQLDTVILPHPLIGKVTVREMMYFTIYHAEHHKKITLRDLGKEIS
jgi:hypothetical protein